MARFRRSQLGRLSAEVTGRLAFPKLRILQKLGNDIPARGQRQSPQWPGAPATLEMRWTEKVQHREKSTEYSFYTPITAAEITKVG